MTTDKEKNGAVKRFTGFVCAWGNDPAPNDRSSIVLISIEEAGKYSEGIVVIGACRVRFRRYAEAEAFVERLKDRIMRHTPCLSLSTDL